MAQTIGPEPLSPENDVTLEREIRSSLGPENESLVEVFKFGLEAETFIQEHTVGKYLVLQCEVKVSDALAIILASNDINTEDCRKAHFDIRVAQGMLGLLNDAVSDGKGAEHVIRGTQIMSEEQSDG